MSSLKELLAQQQKDLQKSQPKIGGGTSFLSTTGTKSTLHSSANNKKDPVAGGLKAKPGHLEPMVMKPLIKTPVTSIPDLHKKDKAQSSSLAPLTAGGGSPVVNSKESRSSPTSNKVELVPLSRSTDTPPPASASTPEKTNKTNKSPESTTPLLATSSKNNTSVVPEESRFVRKATPPTSSSDDEGGNVDDEDARHQALVPTQHMEQLSNLVERQENTSRGGLGSKTRGGTCRLTLLSVVMHPQLGHEVVKRFGGAYAPYLNMRAAHPGLADFMDRYFCDLALEQNIGSAFIPEWRIRMLHTLATQMIRKLRLIKTSQYLRVQLKETLAQKSLVHVGIQGTWAPALVTSRDDLLSNLDSSVEVASLANGGKEFGVTYLCRQLMERDPLKDPPLKTFDCRNLFLTKEKLEMVLAAAPRLEALYLSDIRPANEKPHKRGPGHCIARRPPGKVQFIDDIIDRVTTPVLEKLHMPLRLGGEFLRDRTATFSSQLCDTLTTLVIPRSGVLHTNTFENPQECFNKIARLRNLKHLEVPVPYLGDEYWNDKTKEVPVLDVVFSTCTQLEVVVIADPENQCPSGYIRTMLQCCPKIRQVELPKMTLDLAISIVMTYAAQLEFFGFKARGFDDSILTAIAGHCPNITRFGNVDKGTDVGFYQIASKCSKLRYITISPMVTDDCLRALLQGCPDISGFDVVTGFGNCELTDAAGDHMARHGKSLETFTLARAIHLTDRFFCNLVGDACGHAHGTTGQPVHGGRGSDGFDPSRNCSKIKTMILLNPRVAAGMTDHGLVTHLRFLPGLSSLHADLTLKYSEVSGISHASEDFDDPRNGYPRKDQCRQLVTLEHKKIIDPSDQPGYRAGVYDKFRSRFNKA